MLSGKSRWPFARPRCARRTTMHILAKNEHPRIWLDSVRAASHVTGSCVARVFPDGREIQAMNPEALPLVPSPRPNQLNAAIYVFPGAGSPIAIIDDDRPRILPIKRVIDRENCSELPDDRLKPYPASRSSTKYDGAASVLRSRHRAHILHCVPGRARKSERKSRRATRTRNAEQTLCENYGSSTEPMSQTGARA